MRAQKSATPVEGMKGPKAAAASFRDDRPMAVVLERSSVEEGDIQLRREASLRELVKKLDATSSAKKKNKSAEQQAEEVERLMNTLVSSTIMELAAGFLDPASLRRCVCAASFAGHWCTTVGEGTPDADSVRQRLCSLQGTSSAHMHRFVVASGSRMEQQFVPWYFGVAFVFLSEFCTGMPDMPDWS